MNYLDCINRNGVIDEGRYREYIAEQYGAVLTYGGTNSRKLDAANRHIRRLARLVNLPREDVKRDIINDYRLRG